jgi:quercetin dioxygenase-like cupin family protein
MRMKNAERSHAMGRPTAFLHQPKTSELRYMGDTCSYFLATGDDTGGAFALLDERARRGESVPRHRHPDDDESFYVLEGEVTFFLGDEPGVRVGAGAFVHLPGGTVHGFRIESETARYLIFTTAQHGDFYRAITVPARPGGLPPSEPIAGSEIGLACRRYGIEMVGPLPE